MKKLYFLLIALLVTSISFGQDLIITAVYDGPLTGGLPKGIELYVVNNIADLSIYGVGSANNGEIMEKEQMEKSLLFRQMPPRQEIIFMLLLKLRDSQISLVLHQIIVQAQCQLMEMTQLNYLKTAQ
jgi:hypothetical protein